MTENQLITLRYHWDSSGGWYEIPKKLLDKVDDFRPMGSDSRISKDRQTLYLDAELDGQRFINELRKGRNLSEVFKTVSMYYAIIGLPKRVLNKIKKILLWEK